MPKTPKTRNTCFQKPKPRPMCERGVRKSRKGQTKLVFLPQNREVLMDLGKLLNDPTQEVIHRRLSDDIGLIWAEARSFSRHRQRFVWVKFGREWVYTLGARVLIRNGQALQKYIASIEPAWTSELIGRQSLCLTRGRLMCWLWGLDVKAERSTILTVRCTYMTSLQK